MILTFPLYPILDLDTCHKHGIVPEELLDLWNRKNINLYQLRAKGISEKEYFELSCFLKNKFPDMQLIANDFIRPVLENSEIFSGIHLGQDDVKELSMENFLMLEKKCMEDGFIAGISTHNAIQLEKAYTEILQSYKSNADSNGSLRWSYIAIGPVARTVSKPGGKDPVISDRERAVIFQKIFKMKLHFKNLNRSFPETVMIGGLEPEKFSALYPEILYTEYKFLPIPAIISSAVNMNLIDLWMQCMKEYQDCA